MYDKFAFKDLVIWKDSIQLIKQIYLITNKFPKTELYALTDQIKRATVSISLNIAEGKGRYSKKEFIHFLYLARGSLYEVVSCLEISLELNFIKTEEYQSLEKQLHKLQCQINALIKSIAI